MPFTFANFNLDPFAVIDHNHDYKSFVEFCEPQQITELDRGLQDIWHREQLEEEHPMQRE